MANIYTGSELTTEVPERRCGPCTACCEGWLPGRVLDYEMKPGTPCHYLGSPGCSIYADRPADPCRNFLCAWMRSPDIFPDAFRPDRVGAIIRLKGWRNRPAYMVISTARDPDDVLCAWVRDYAVRTETPFLYLLRHGRLQALGSPAFRQEMLERQARRERLL